MDDHDEGHPPASRPSTARKLDSDNDAVSPTPQNADGKRPATDGTALLPENIPLLRPPAVAAPESSYLESPSMNLKHSDSQAEIIVRQHLQDIESSFTAPLSPLPTSNNGLDDTFVFDSPSKKPAPPRPAHDADKSTDEFPDQSADQSQILPTLSRQTSGTAQDADESSLQSAHDLSASDVGNGTASLEAFSSSPTAAATARSISRAVSQAASVRSEVNHEHHDTGTDEHTQDLSADDSLLQRSSNASLSEENSRDHSRERTPVDAGHTPGQALKASKRPKYLRSRMGSQRSSVSSLLTDPESDVTVGMGADYALQSGGAVPALGMPRGLNNPLSRSISMGSMASGIEDLHDSSGPAFGHLETLDEADDSISPQPEGRHIPDRAALQTPKPTKTALAAPTDTVIARHVRDVQVPESLAKEYKNRGGVAHPSTAGDIRHGRLRDVHRKPARQESDPQGTEQHHRAPEQGEL